MVYSWPTIFVIAVSADDLAAYAAKSSAGTVLTKMLHLFFMKFLFYQWLGILRL